MTDRLRYVRRMIGYTMGYCRDVDISRAVTARRLAEDLSRLSADASALADEALWDLTRPVMIACQYCGKPHKVAAVSAKAVADALGLTEAAVRKAVQQHNRRKMGLPAKRKYPVKRSGE